MREIKYLIENLKGKTPEEKAFSAKKEVLKYEEIMFSEKLVLYKFLAFSLLEK